MNRKITKEFLQEHYVLLKKTSEQIGFELDCTGRTIRYQLLKYGFGEIMKERRRTIGVGKSPSNKGQIGIFKSPLKGLTKYNHEGIARRSKLKEGKKRLDITGEKQLNWKGGTTSEAMKIRNSPEYKKWRTGVFKRANFTCQECKQRGGKLHADHIKEFALYPELRLDINNGRALCVNCHSKRHPHNLSLLGKAKTEEHKLSMSEAAILRWSKFEERKKQSERLKIYNAAWKKVTLA